MIPSRGIARSLPSVGIRRQFSTRSAIQSTAAVRRTINGARLGSSLRTIGGLSSGSPLRATYISAPIALATLPTSRAFSLWGSSKPSTPAEPEAAPPASAAPVEATSPVQQTPTAAVSTPETAAAPPASTELNVPTTDVDLSALESVIQTPDILNMAEEPGYLHALGLDYGWGPTSVMQWVLEHVHFWSGLGWGGSILATAVLLRAFMIYPQIKSQQFSARMTEMRKDPRAEEAMKLVRQSVATSDTELRQRASFMNKMLQKEYGVSNWEMLWGFGQIPFSYGLFRIVSGMASIPVPALESSDFLWFSNLAATDPYLIMPAIGTAFMVSSLAINAKYQKAQQKKMMKTIVCIIGPIGFIATCFMSAAVNIMAAGLGACTVLTAAVLNTAVVRRQLGLPTDIPQDDAKPKGTYEAPRKTSPGLAGVRERLTANLEDAKKGFSDQMSSMTGGYAETDQDRAEKKRKEMIQKLENMRRQQENDEFNRKYKSKNRS